MSFPIPDRILAADELGRVHFIGIGGAGLSAIARLMNESGLAVSGSDAQDSDVLTALRAEGITCFVGHAADHVAGADTVVASTAVRDDNPEVVEARRLGLRLWPRSAGLRSVMIGRRTLAVAGTHGKTTTTAMLTYALRAAGDDPTFAIGAEVAGLGTNARLGSSQLMVAEADESDGAFLVYRPAGAIVTNVDADHLDVWGDAESYAAAFARFAETVGEFLVVGVDDPGARALSATARSRGLRVITSGFADDADVRGIDVRIENGRTLLTATYGGEPLADLDLAVPGEHYAQDALAALAAGLALGFPAGDLARGLGEYSGARRRMEPLGEAAGVRVYDSYAHHPTEIAADVAAGRALAGSGRLVVVYQPHLVSRTRELGTQMGEALSAADAVYVADLYVAREDPDPAVSSAIVVDAVSGPPARLAGPVEDVARVVVPDLQPGDLVLTLGAGDITTVGPQILALLDRTGLGESR
ncbi:MAG TPA: UDP-N-acetylmuramate--L-alanine ligase [Aeromicrobium sp.]|nr:UDP-N-acetylmuramate--L-alanine ligase [Aeromicrobium sp.]